MKYLSNHAFIRCLERGITFNEIENILALVKPIYKAGIQLYYCREKNIPFDLRKKENCRKLIGWTVLVGGNTIITVYKNSGKESFRNNKKNSNKKWYLN